MTKSTARPAINVLDPMLDPSPRQLGSSFFDRKAERVARDLIGCHLVHKRGCRFVKYAITETEAYVGPHDLACHAARGRTKRTEPMFGPPGTFYVYLVYGLHWMLNVVTGPVGYPAAVLLRSAGGITGPGRLARALGVTGTLNGRPVGPEAGVWFTTCVRPASLQILRTPRVGVDYAGPHWSAKPLRFLQAEAQ